MTWTGAPAEVAVLQVALVTLGRHIGLLNSWYYQPEDNKVGAWCSMPPWWYSLEMRKLRLRQNINALYLYDTVTEEQMLLYRPGKVTLDSNYSRTSTIASRLEVWTL